MNLHNCQVFDGEIIATLVCVFLIYGYSQQKVKFAKQKDWMGISWSHCWLTIVHNSPVKFHLLSLVTQSTGLQNIESNPNLLLFLDWFKIKH